MRRTNTSLPWPTPDLGEIREKTTVRSIVAGRVIDVRIASVVGDEATVEVTVQLEAGAAPPASISGPAGDVGRVVEVIDGDTVKVRLEGQTQAVKIRLIGVDTPETKHPDKPVQCFGPEASSFTRSMLLGREVRLEYDVERYDKYGRTLAYMWLGDQMFNEVLVSEGYARTLTIPPNVRHAAKFAALEQEARAQRRGLWGVCE
ncbi:MAG: thermonuclease family protein [Anaerolineae bacterium]|nr:thermonuclease family protein [Anaerolineae bacterium]